MRYKLADDEKFKLRIGAHPGFNFRKILNEDMEEVIQTERYLTGELAPTYQISENIKLGVYYLLSHGFDINSRNPLHFLTFNATFSQLRISRTLSLEIIPEMYYLSSFGDGEGLYFTALIELSKSNFPLSLSSRINQAISTEVDGRDFLWNLTLTYNFRKANIALK